MELIYSILLKNGRTLKQKHPKEDFQKLGHEDHPQPGTSNQVESRRPWINCTPAGDMNTLGKTVVRMFLHRCRTRSHATEMCQVPTQPATGNTICIYCGSINHTSCRCHNKQTIIERNQGQHRGASEIKDPGKPRQDGSPGESPSD